MYKHYELEVLTPLAIGSGSKISPLEYLISNKQFVRINMEKFFIDKRFEPNKFIVQAETGQLNLARDWPFAANYPLYSLSGDQHTLAELAQNRSEINEFVRDAADWAVPASSLKGALRTWTYQATMSEADHQKWLKKIEETAADPKRKKEYATAKAEQTISGTPNYSAFRALRLGDSAAAASTNMAIYAARVLSLRQDGGYGWKQLPRNSVYDPRQATVIFFEGIRPGTRLAGRVTLDKDLLATTYEPLVGKYLFDNWLFQLRTAVRRYLADEKSFFAKIRLKPLINQYEHLESIADGLNTNQLMLPVGWGTGYTVKTIRGKMSDDKFRRLATIYNLQLRDGFPFPKTRKIVFIQGEPATVCGMVKLTFKED